MSKLKGFLGSTATFKTRQWGPLTVESIAISAAIDGDLAVYFGSPFSHPCPLVRIHSECVFGEVLGSELCDCAQQLEMALTHLSEDKAGILLYLRLDGRGAGLSAKVKATDLETRGVDTYESRIQIGVPPDSRDYTAIGYFLKNRGLSCVRLLSNNPDKGDAIARAGIEVRPEPIIVRSNNPNIRKLYATKAKRFRHAIPVDLQEPVAELQLELDLASWRVPPEDEPSNR